MHYFLGTLVSFEGKKTGAEKEFRRELRSRHCRFVAYQPELGLAWAMLGMSEFQTREYSRSLDHLQRAAAQGMGDHKDIAESVSIT